MNCIILLNEGESVGDVKKKEIVELADAWKRVSHS